MAHPLDDRLSTQCVSEIWTAGPVVQSVGGNPVKSRLGMGYNGEYKLTQGGESNIRFGDEYNTDIHTFVGRKLGYTLNGSNSGRVSRSSSNEYDVDMRRSSILTDESHGYTRRLTGYHQIHFRYVDGDMESAITTAATDRLEENNELILSPASGSVKLKNYIQYQNPDPTASPTDTVSPDDSLTLEYDQILTCNLDSFKQNANGIYTRGVVFDVTDLPKKILILVHARKLKTIDLHDPHNPIYRSVKDIYTVKYHKYPEYGVFASEQALITVTGMNNHVVTVKLIGPTKTRVNYGDNAIKFRESSKDEWYWASPLLLLEGRNSLILFSEQLFLESGMYDKVATHCRILGGENTFIIDTGKYVSGRLYGQHILLHDPERSSSIVSYTRITGNNLGGLIGSREQTVKQIGNEKGTKGQRMVQWMSWRETRTYRDGGDWLMSLSEIPTLTYPNNMTNFEYIPLEDSMSKMAIICKDNKVIDVDSRKPTVVKYGDPNWATTAQTYGKAINVANVPSVLKRITDFYRYKRIPILNQHPY